MSFLRREETDSRFFCEKRQKQFLEACDKIIDKDRERSKIGTLSEKTVHAVMKNFLEPDESYHEIKIEGYFADIAREGNIIEIQTRSFNALRNKLEVFLKRGSVTVVYPIPYIKWLCWINEETGEVSKRRKSPKKGCIYESFFELYKIKQYLTDPNFHLELVLINLEESRLLNGWSQDKKKGSTRYDRIPTELKEEIFIDSPQDYGKLIPDGLGENFTVKEYKEAAKVSSNIAGKALNVLKYVGAVEQVGKRGREYVYERKEVYYAQV